MPSYIRQIFSAFVLTCFSVVLGCDDEIDCSAENVEQVGNSITAAAADAAKSLSTCSVDADCVAVEIHTDCISGCCVAVAKSNVEKYRSEEKDISDKYCQKVKGCAVNSCDMCFEVRCISGYCGRNSGI